MQVSRRRRAIWWAPALALAVIVVAAGCAPNPPGVPGEGDGGDGSAGDALVGRTFLSTSVTEDGQPRPLVPGTQVQLSFPSRGRFTASAGCNIHAGTVEVQRDRLVMEVQTSTERACDLPREEQDAWLVGFLSGDPAYVLRGTFLRLQVGATVMELVDREVTEPDRPLIGTQWELASIVDDDVVRSLPAGTGATLTFGDGTVGFQVQDCNTGGGAAVIGDTTVEIGALRQTLMACGQGPSEVEYAVVTVLNGMITYDIDATVLRLTHPSGRGLILRATT
jgi:heat shock protein HslJ